MSFRPKSLTGVLILLITTCTLTPPTMAKAPSTNVKSLKAKKRATLQKRRAVETKLRAVKRQQRSVSQDFHHSEARLASAETELRRARVRLAATERQINETQRRLTAIKAELEQQTTELWQRLELFYKQGSVGYVEVVLGATDFEQFVDRAVFVSSIAEQDLALKQAIEDSRTQQEALQAELERKWAECNSLRQQCGERAQQIRVETNRKHQLLANVKRDRAQQEAAYQELIETQKEIDRILWRINRPSGGRSSSGPIRKLSGGFILPVNGRFSSPFGWRIHPITGTRRFHDGQDIAASSGTTIRAAASGTVVKSGWMKAYGKTIMINHGSGYTTLYGHCSALLVSEGQSVSQGQPVARVGSTGWSTGPHVHFSVYRNGTAINPMSVR